MDAKPESKRFLGSSTALFLVIGAIVTVLFLFVGLPVLMNRPLGPEEQVKEHIRTHTDYEAVDTLEKRPDSVRGEAIFHGKTQDGRKGWEFRVKDGRVSVSPL